MMHYEKIRKHVYIDYEKSYDYVSESYYSFLIRMGES